MNAIASSDSYIPQAVKDLCGLVRHRQQGLDRVEIQFDSSALELPMAELKRLSSDKTDLFQITSRFQRIRKTTLHLFQPSTEALELLRDSIGNEHAAYITYAECATDFITRSQPDANTVQSFLLSHVQVPSWQQFVSRHLETHYYAGRWTAGDEFEEQRGARDKKKPARRRAKNFALYAHQESKLHGPWSGRPCAHFEIRLSGAPALAKAGIFGIGDLIDLDYDALWDRMIWLKRFTSLADLGRWLDPDNTDVSDAALRKRAHRFMSEHEIGGSFVLQNAVIKDRSIGSVLEAMQVRWVFSEG